MCTVGSNRGSGNSFLESDRARQRAIQHRIFRADEHAAGATDCLMRHAATNAMGAHDGAGARSFYDGGGTDTSERVAASAEP